MSPDAALVACRLLHDLSAMLLFGSFAFIVVLVPDGLSATIGRRLTSFRRVAIAMAIATTAASLPLQSAIIGDGWGDAIDPATLHDVLFATSVGAAWQVQAVAALLLGATLLVPIAQKSMVTALAAGIVVASLALSGHAAMQEGMTGIAHRANDALHLISGAAWLGALVPLLPILRMLDDPANRADAALALRRFSTAGHGAVALVVVTGVVNTILVVGGWPLDWTFPYQALLVAKIALVALMTGIAIINRYRFVPMLARRHDKALTAIRTGTIAEIVIGIGVISLVATFGMMAPN